MKKLPFALELKQKMLLFFHYDQRQGVPKRSTLTFIAKLFIEKMIRTYQKIFFLDQWYLMFELNKDRPISFQNFNAITPPKDRFWADPHVIEFNEHYFVFVEEYLYKNRKAHISVMEMDKRGNYKDPVKILEREYHLSYPSVFRHNDRYYMVPESATNKTIELYECTEFPYEWSFKMNLMENVNAVDTTIFHFQDKWWLFTGMQEDERLLPLAKLYLFISRDLFTQNWIPHPLNPIESDVAKARPAGSLFVKDGRIFRPSQNCSKTYGYGFFLNEVLRLSESDYLEKTVRSVTPDWNQKILGVHTYTNDGQITFIDAFTRRRKVF